MNYFMLLINWTLLLSKKIKFFLAYKIHVNIIPMYWNEFLHFCFSYCFKSNKNKFYLSNFYLKIN